MESFFKHRHLDLWYFPRDGRNDAKIKNGLWLDESQKANLARKGSENGTQAVIG